MNRFAAFLAAASLALLASVPAFAQSTYNTPSGVRVNGVVPLACDTSAANCAPSVTVGTPADAGANANSGQISYSRGYVFNGTTWDRQRGDTNGTVSQPALSSTFWNYAAAAGGITNTTTAVTVKAAAGASVRNYVSSMQCTSDALGAATELAIRDGAAGTVIWRGKIQTTGWIDGTEITFNPALRGSANTLVEIVTLTASVTGSVYCNLQGYTGS